MLRLILGGAGTGKSARLAGEMASRRREGKRVFYLVPEQYSFEMERRFYQDDIQVYSMERLADAVFRACGGLAGAYASDTVQLILMREAVREAGGNLSLLRRSAAQPGFASGMLALKNELSRAGVDAGKGGLHSTNQQGGSGGSGVRTSPLPSARAVPPSTQKGTSEPTRWPISASSARLSPSP